MYLKTLAGLKRVHAILRRLDDAFCDPLELRSDSALGVPGLIGAVRAGGVLLANALGTGLLESAALLGFLPGVCRAPVRRAAEDALRGDLVVRGARRSSTSSRKLDELVIKSAYPNQHFEPVFGGEPGGTRRARR